jgi:predicted AAA+ superfamily ATPase
MIARRLLPSLTGALAEAPAVALLGPRQAGKTTLALEVAKARPAVYLDLESEADRAKLSEPELYLPQHEDGRGTNRSSGAPSAREPAPNKRMPPRRKKLARG